MPHQIFKILTPQQWQLFQKEKVFQGSPLDLADGFIHMSFAHQWENVWTKFFKNSEIILVEINANLLDPQILKIEANSPGGTQYPHYYGYLTLEMVIDFKKVAPIQT
jgi:uncharacterized protein (DUF952 family)